MWRASSVGISKQRTVARPGSRTALKPGLREGKGDTSREATAVPSFRVKVLPGAEV